LLEHKLSVAHLKEALPATDKKNMHHMLTEFQQQWISSKAQVLKRQKAA